jgi:hypothetical protein
LSRSPTTGIWTPPCTGMAAAGEPVRRGPHETQAPIPVGGCFAYRIQFPDPGCTGTTLTFGRTTPRSWACTATSSLSRPTLATGGRWIGSWS